MPVTILPWCVNLRVRCNSGLDAAKKRDLVAAKMTPAQVEKAQALAAEWKPTTGQLAP